MTYSILYLPISRKTFDNEAAEEYRALSVEKLQEVAQVEEPGRLLSSVDELREYLTQVDSQSFDAIVYQSTTFADAEFPDEVTKWRREPVVVWSVREPSTGGRLRLNSLTGGNSTSNLMKVKKHPFQFIFGNPDEERCITDLKRSLVVLKTQTRLKNLKIGVIGDHPPGFYFSDTDEQLLKEKTGVSVEAMDLYHAFNESKKIEQAAYEPAIALAEKQVIGLNRSDETVTRFAQFYTYVEEQIQQRDIEALAIRCWPDFFTELGAAACSTLSQFTEHGVVSSCESDIHGSVSMFILQELSGGSAPYLGDLVHVDEEHNSFVFWHCGAAAYSLASPATGATAGVHPNRKLGMTMEFGLKAGNVTIFRLHYDGENFKFLVFRGKATDRPQHFNGTSVEVEIEKDVRETLDHLMGEGYEPHYAIVYADVVDEVKRLGKVMNIPVDVV
ncbi:sulfoquinovose isomerase [Jeotgalibacillus haloalkalitolerans]|uniref:L-fucose isomerase C-terminal domain-containing protein n=1 Tax=Jeotgalibacillus haloalkalitolerans TaxID=3104292 RepID=A0ABU5KJG0_9BACL|nr:hypothetical protein [Jeotgalibacillus sp. HH7-29]MDZ5711394.1 hypothetical protein [Jeotgalibacillus sp. HH7-29]